VIMEEVIDLGINAKSEDFLEAIKEHTPGVLALSALLITIMTEQQRVIKGFKKKKVRDKVKVIVGGSPHQSGVRRSRRHRQLRGDHARGSKGGEKAFRNRLIIWIRLGKLN